MPQPNHDDYISKIPNEDLLDVLLDHADYSHFRRVGEDDYRDPQEKNSSLSLSSKYFLSKNLVNFLRDSSCPSSQESK